MSESSIYGQLLRTAYGLDGINVHGVDDDDYEDMKPVSLNFPTENYYSRFRI